MAWGVLAWQVLIRIPVGTALFEETMFRGVLYGAWRRTMRWWQAAILSSVAFALWHVVVEMHRQEREGHAWGMDGLINTLLVLVLQPHLPFASLVVCASRSGLMASAPA
jgi:membrane protease YdiL (CAAX protease family)